MLKRIFLFFILFLGICFSSEWTIMIYLDGDNDLEEDAIVDFLEISKIGSDENVKIVVQFDRISGYDNSYGNWTICHRFYITPGITPTESNAINDWGDGIGGREVNMGDTQTLNDFVRWAIKNYPSNKYALILWDHGNGWKRFYQALFEGKKEKPVKEICYDDTSYDSLSIKELREALENIGEKIDIIGFDACLMGMIEVANEVKNECNVMIASEETEPTTGWVYDVFLRELKKNPQINPYQLAELIVNSYDDLTLSAIDLTKINELNQKLNQVLQEIISLNEWLNVFLARCNSRNFDEPDYIDLYDFFNNLYLKVEDQTLKNLIGEFKDTFNQIVFSDNNINDNAFGLSIYFPDYGETIDPDYNEIIISFPFETFWYEFLNNFINSDLFSGYELIFSEDFSSGFSSWTIIDGYNDKKTWTNTNPGHRYLNLNPPFMIVDSDWAGEVNMDEQLISPSFNFKEYSKIYLKFKQVFLYYSGNEIADVDIKIGDGNWQNLIRYKGEDKEGEAVIDISEIAKGKDNVKIRWHYYNANFDWYWAIDNIEIYGKTNEVKGDINGDETVDITDVILCLRMAVDLPVSIGGQTYNSPYPDWLKECADMNNDGEVDITDVILILRKAVGLDQ